MLWAVPALAFNYSSPDTPKAKVPAQESATALPPESTVNFKAESKKLADAKSRPIDFKTECKKSASDVSKRDINRLSGQIKTQGEAFRKELKGTAERAEKAEKDRNDVSKELVVAKGETAAAIKEHTKSNKGLVESFNGLKNDISGVVASVGRTEYYCGGIAILILGLGIFIYFRTKGTDKLVKEVGTKVDETPEKTAVFTELLRKFVLRNVAGHNIERHPILLGGRVRTLKLPENTPEATFANSADIPRLQAKSLSHLKSTDAGVLEQYFAGGFEGDDYKSKLQKAIVEFSIATEETVIL